MNVRRWGRCALAFVAGALIEALNTRWTQAANHRERAVVVVIALAASTMQIAGLAQSLRDRRAAACFVLGYGAGAFAAMSWWNA